MLQIGHYILNNRLILAPMAGITDRPFRNICRRLGAGLAVSEMVSSNSLLWGSVKTQRRADHHGEQSPSVVQILGADPKLMADAARYNVEHGAEIIDINMGCPAKKVCNVRSGAALLRDEQLVAQILQAVVTAVAVPVTLKIRTGWDQHHRNGVKIAQLAEEHGIKALAVHGRTRACGYSGSAEYDTIRAIKNAVTIPVIANGDIRSPEQAKMVLDYTDADGVMIGRAAQGQPWIFREIQQFLTTGEKLAAPNSNEIISIIFEHLEQLYSFYGATTGSLIARKHLSWYIKGQPGAANYRVVINRTTNIDQQFQIIRDYFSSLS